MKDVSELVPQDFAQYPVWEACDDLHDTCVAPVLSLPVTSMDNRIVGTKLELRNGMSVWGFLANLSLRNVRLNAQFLTLAVTRNGRWFYLARYFDADYQTRSPAKLADFLELAVDEVFPLSYDLSHVALGHPDAVRGTIPAEPRERLSDDEITKLAVRGDEA